MADLGSTWSGMDQTDPGASGGGVINSTPGASDTSTVGAGGAPTGGFSLNLGGLGSAISNAVGLSPQQLSAIAGGAQMFNNAGQFTTQSQQDAAYLDPAQQFQTGYGKQLQALEADPSAIANTPGYQFALNQGLGAVNRKDMMTGGAAPNSDDIAFASGLAQQTYNSQVAQLTQLSGANFSPQSAASILQTGMLGNIGAQTAGLNGMMAGMFGNPGTPGGGGGGGGAPTTFTPGGTNYSPGGTSGGSVPIGSLGSNGGGYQISTGGSTPGNVYPVGASDGSTSNSQIVPGSPDFLPPPPPDYSVNTDNGGSMFDPSWFNSMSS